MSGWQAWRDGSDPDGGANGGTGGPLDAFRRRLRPTDGPDSPGSPHRLLPLRVALEVIAAAEAGYLLVVVPGWTPVRSVLAAVALLAAIAAASAVVVLLGTTFRIRPPLAVLLAVALLAGVAGPAAATRLADPTQVGPADLGLSVSCAVVTDAGANDGHALDVRVSIEWLRKDLLTTGVMGDPWTDAVMAIPVPQGSVPAQSASGAWKDPARAGEAYDSPPAGWHDWSGPATAAVGKPPSEFSWYPDTWTDWHASVARNYGFAFAAVDPAITARTVHTGTWEYIPDSPGAAIPAVYAEFRHASRFTVGTFASCTDPTRQYPRLERRLSDY